ncbi:MAG: DUF5722 domain-containing protein, partial [Oscillospiraceae bacterium]|nr:DUF5722 domain-containing protein [Oscillospiraceae bacterium]
GVRYTTDIAENVATNRQPYPQPAVIKAMSCGKDDVLALGIKQKLFNVNLPSIMTAVPHGETPAASGGTLFTKEGGENIPFEHCGKTYWFLKDRIESLDRQMLECDELGVTVTLILLNSPKRFGSTEEQILLDACIHPGFDQNYPDAFISAFDMQTEEGQGYYRAFCEFLAARYTRTDRKYGSVSGFIISNEVDSQYVWGNAGEMPVEDYTREYTEAMRLAWLCAQLHCAHLRIYASLDHLWNIRHMPTEPLRTYTAKSVIDNVCAHSRRDGNFPWNIAFHPYPEDLRWPNFWNDRSADFAFSTQRITFRNMEVLPAYLAQEHLLYKNSPRRIIFSEQGFNSLSGDLGPLTEAMAEAAYVLAYLKARAIETLDMLTHHSYLDNPHEFGLNLGIRRHDPSKPGNIGEPKPIYEAVRDMETEREPQRIAKARAYIGEEIFDYLLNPPEIAGAPAHEPNAPSDFGG